MKPNRFNRLMDNPQDDLEIASDGLSSRLDDFLKDTPDGEIPDKPVEENIPDGSDKPDLEDHVIPDEEEEFPALGEPPKGKVDASAFDETAFDAQTAAILAGLEAKGHPGEVYKSLRAELKLKTKELTEVKSAPPQVELPDEVKTELETLRAKATEADALRQRNEELLKVNDTVAVQESETFIKQIKEPIAEMEEILATIAETAGLDPAVLFAIIMEKDVAKQDKALDSIQSKVGTRMLGRIERMADDYKAIQAKSAKMIADAPKTLAAERARIEQEVVQQKQSRLTAFKSATRESFTAYSQRVPGFTDDSGQLTDIAKATMEKTATLDPESLSPNDLAFMAFAANSLPEMRRAYVKLQKDYNLLKAGKPTPKPLGGNNIPDPAAKENPDEPMGLADAMKGKEFTFSGV